MLDRLKKIQRLAEYGAPGERDAARAMLEGLLRRHGITEEQLADREERRLVCASFRAEWERRLAVQIIAKLDRDCRRGVVGREVRALLSAADAVEFEISWPLLRRAYRAELRVFFRAFCVKNDLLADATTERKPTAAEIDEAIRAEEMAGGIKFVARRKALPPQEARR